MLKFDVQTGEFEFHDPCLCSFGITETIALFVGSALTGAIFTAGTAEAIAAVAAPAIVGAVGGAAIGAGGAALTGGNVGKGALTGGLTGAIGGGLIGAFGGPAGSLTGALGGSTTASGAVLGAGAGALGSAITGGNVLQGAITGGIGGGLAGSLSAGPTAEEINAQEAGLTGPFGVPPAPPGDPGGAFGTGPGSPVGTNTDVIPTAADPHVQGTMFSSIDDASKALGSDQGFANPVAPGALNAQSAQAAKGSSGSGGGSGGSGSGDNSSSSDGAISKFLNGKTGGISNGALALGALSAVSSLLNKPTAPQINVPGGVQTPGAAQNPNVGPLFNQPLQLNPPGAGRQAVTPDIPNYYTYGQIPGGATYFNNNSLAAYGYARGGALTGPEREFRNGSGNHRVRGPGTETSDSIPARLSNNEYVLDAGDVRRIGGGSADRGAAILDRQRKKLTRGGGALSQLGRAA